MTSYTEIFDATITGRKSQDWISILEFVTADLGRHISNELSVISCDTENSVPDHASHGVSAEIRSTVKDALGITIDGRLCITINHNEDVFITAYLYLSILGKLLLPNGIIEGPIGINRTIDEWSGSFIDDEFPGEWDAYTHKVAQQVSASEALN